MGLTCRISQICRSAITFLALARVRQRSRLDASCLVARLERGHQRARARRVGSAGRQRRDSSRISGTRYMSTARGACSPTSRAAPAPCRQSFTCSGKGPDLSPGPHRLEVAAFTSDGESPRSSPLMVTVGGATSTAPGHLANGNRREDGGRPFPPHRQGGRRPERSCRCRLPPRRPAADRRADTAASGSCRMGSCRCRCPHDVDGRRRRRRVVDRNRP